MDICINCSFYATPPWEMPCRDCPDSPNRRSIFDKAKGEINMADYLFSEEKHTIKNPIYEGKTFYSIISGPMKIKNVIFNDPATIVFWGDGTKTVVKCGKNDIFDPEKGLALAISKKLYGNKGNYYNVIKKWLPEEYKKDCDELRTCSRCKYFDCDLLSETCRNCLEFPEKPNFIKEIKNGK